MWEILREVGHNLRRRPFQSTLAILGVLGGMAGVLILSSMGAGVHESIDKQVAAIGPGIMEAVSVPSSNGQTITEPLRMGDATNIAATLQGVALVSPLAEAALTVSGPKTFLAGDVIGVNGEFPNIQQINVTAGSFFSSVDDVQGKSVAVIGDSLAKQLFGSQSPIGRQISVQNTIETVVGVFSFSNSVAVGGPTNLVLIPIKAFMTQLTAVDQIGGVMLKVLNPQDVPSMKDTILTILARDHHWRVPLSSFQIYTQNGILSASQSLQDLFSLFVEGSIWISFVVGGIGIMNVMLMAVTDRRHEIGLFLAFGARPRIILTQFLVESTLISLVGTIGGVLVGTLIGLLLLLRGITLDFPVEVYLQDIGIGLLLGVLFGFYPSFRASTMRPVQAIRE